MASGAWRSASSRRQGSKVLPWARACATRSWKATWKSHFRCQESKPDRVTVPGTVAGASAPEHLKRGGSSRGRECWHTERVMHRAPRHGGERRLVDHLPAMVQTRGGLHRCRLLRWAAGTVRKPSRAGRRNVDVIVVIVDQRPGGRHRVGPLVSRPRGGHAQNRQQQAQQRGRNGRAAAQRERTQQDARPSPGSANGHAAFRYRRYPRPLSGLCSSLNGRECQRGTTPRPRPPGTPPFGSAIAISTP